jgi:serine/threonine protein kinase
MAAATQHLHSRGILHGDLYAHNILHTAQGDALLSDFGAAAFFDERDATLAQGLEKIEVRALGCLLQELSMQCDVAHSYENSHQALAQLAQQCMRDVPSQRPNLQQINTVLKGLVD